MIENPRESRLHYEFERMRSIRRKGGLIEFRCADLTEEEEFGVLDPRTFVLSRLDEAPSPNYLTPEMFLERYPERAPEKYLVLFSCRGIMKMPEGQYKETFIHIMEVVFGVDYPSVPPLFVWRTPVWHPNILPPFVCPNDRPFSVGTTLDQLCVKVGQMIQYQFYNVDDPWNRDAAAWAAENMSLFPLDRRDLLDGHVHEQPAVTSPPARTDDGGDLSRPLDELGGAQGPIRGTDPLSESEPLVTLLS
jgi:ubiquitin-protein ligase